MRGAMIALLLATATASTAGATDGRAVFVARCARCHGDTGRGDGPAARALKVSPLVDSPDLAAMSADAIAASVKSDARHRGVVDLRDDELRAAAEYVKELARHPPAGAPKPGPDPTGNGR